jgi:hypothetical protein
MSFDLDKQLLVGLAKIELPAYTMRLCDGGFVYFNAEKYTSADASFGSIASLDAFEEQSGDEAPGGKLTFLPKDTAAAATLSQPTYQGSRIRFWLARVVEATGIIAESELVADMELDTTTLRVGRSSRILEMEFISTAERLFNISDGNVLSPRFHKSVWAGELGLDNATGIPLTVAWGVKGPPRGTAASGSSAGGGGSGGAGGGGGGVAMVGPTAQFIQNL